jgi:nucleoside-diphosphate-sugar epimerase
MAKLNQSLDLAIPKGSRVLVTGATGYLATHIINEFLMVGYKVIGTARNSEKADQTRELFAQYGSSNYDCVVPDMAADGAFDEAVKGISAFVHTASVTSFDKDLNKVIPTTVAGVTTALKAAAKEKSVKRFVFTSSSVAATLPKPGKKFHIDSSTWNEESVKVAWKPPPYKDDMAWHNYAASKIESEKAVWEFAKDEKPGFVVNTICPNANMGKILAKDQSPSTGQWVLNLYNGNNLKRMKAIPPRLYLTCGTPPTKC